MNLSNEQCIEIAEKVWGWEALTEETYMNYCIDTVWDKKIITHLDRAGNSLWGEDSIPDLVNSWQGFGRTVEAMAKNFYELAPNIDHNGFASGAIGFCRYDYVFHDLNCQHNMDKPDKIITATHLAALETMK